jgi:hypothetical protein
MAIPSSTFTEMVTTTLRHHKRKIVDNVTEHNALLRYMKERGNIQTDASGGYEIAMPLAYAENDTYQRFYGGEVLNIGDSDVLTSAKYDWKQVALHVTATGRELKLNNSKERMINLVKARVQVAMDTAANNMSIDLYSDGSAANQIGGLQHLVQTAGTGTVGSINSGTYSFWQNKQQELATPGTFSALKADMNSLWLSCVRGNDKPDLCVLSHDLYSTYEGGLQDLQRYGDSKAAGMGFESLKYKSASVIFDDNSNFGTTSETGYFIDTKYLHLKEHPEARWTEDEHKTPINQDKTVVPIYWMGALCTDRRAGLGILHDSA